MDPRVEEVIAFWFGNAETATSDAIRRWFVKDADFDDQIRTRFGALHDEASSGGLVAWRGAARGELALLVVLDQFSRNLFRGDRKAFAQDHLALAIANDLLDSERFRALGYEQRLVALLPFEHAEDLAMQKRGVTAFATLVAEARASGADTDTLALLENGLDYAEQHAVIIERFGRFPHRNAVLGRPSTEEELAFLKTPGSSF